MSQAPKMVRKYVILRLYIKFLRGDYMADSSSSGTTVKEYFLGVDEFKHPKSYTQQDATYVLLIRLILLEKGTYPTRPDMGVGIVSRYRWANTDQMEQLKTDISDQITTYLPEFQDVDVAVSASDLTILIEITIDGYTYQVTYTREVSTLSAL